MWLLSVHGELYEMDRRLVKESLLLPFISGKGKASEDET